MRMPHLTESISSLKSGRFFLEQDLTVLHNDHDHIYLPSQSIDSNRKCCLYKLFNFFYRLIFLFSSFREQFLIILCHLDQELCLIKFFSFNLYHSSLHYNKNRFYNGFLTIFHSILFFKPTEQDKDSNKEGQLKE